RHHPRSHVLVLFSRTATTEIYTLSLHDALPIWNGKKPLSTWWANPPQGAAPVIAKLRGRFEKAAVTVKDDAAPAADRVAASSFTDRKSTRLNSSHLGISYAVFCLKKKKNNTLEQ